MRRASRRSCAELRRAPTGFLGAQLHRRRASLSRPRPGQLSRQRRGGSRLGLPLGPCPRAARVAWLARRRRRMAEPRGRGKVRDLIRISTPSAICDRQSASAASAPSIGATLARQRMRARRPPPPPPQRGDGRRRLRTPTAAVRLDHWWEEDEDGRSSDVGGHSAAPLGVIILCGRRVFGHAAQRVGTKARHDGEVNGRWLVRPPCWDADSSWPLAAGRFICQETALFELRRQSGGVAQLPRMCM